MNKIRQVSISIFIFLISASAHAIAQFNAGDVSALTTTNVSRLIDTVAIGTDHRALMPASALGYAIGLDLGVQADGIFIPQEFVDAMKLAGVTGNVPKLIPIPKLVAHKGLPLNIDVGASFFAYKGIRIFGLDLKYAFLPGSAALPAVAARVSFNSTKLYFINASVWKVDVLASKSLLFIEPYVGAGLEMASGTLDVPLSGALGLKVSAESSTSQPHLFVGVPIAFGVFKITGEYDYSFLSLSTASAKFSFSF